MIKGIIFDFDGLIFDTETLQYHVLQDIFAKHGGELTLSRWQQEIGTHTGFQPFQYLEEQIGRKLDQEMIEKEFLEQLDDTLSTKSPRPGVEDYLKTAKQLDLKVGLASSSGYKWVEKHLKRLGLYDYFECIKTADDVEIVKPDPALYYQAAECLGLTRDTCLVFEDSANGALAAKNAGTTCVIVPNEVTNAMTFCEVDYRLDSMSSLSLQDVLEIVEK